MMKTALWLFFLAGLFGTALSALFGNNFLVGYLKTWSEAREYCREYYTDLSSISDWGEETEIRSLTGYWNTKAWIGLYKADNAAWKWSGGKNATFFNWADLLNTTDSCVVHNTWGWHKTDCESKFPFYCFQSRLILVKKNMTWEKAMEQCRQQRIDLVSVYSESALIKTLQTGLGSQTDHLWIGLRYLAGNWLWVNGENMEYQAWRQAKTPQCPAWGQQCGVLSLEEQQWDSWNCAAKLNFVCF